LPIFNAAIAAEALPWIYEIADLLPGRRVVEFNAGATLHGPVIRAMGALSYHGINPNHDPENRTYTSHTAGTRVKTKLTAGTISAILKGMYWARDIGTLEPKSFDLALAHTRGGTDVLETIISCAERLLAPGGKLWVRWYNSYSWSGHGRAPRHYEEINPEEPAQKAVLDWRHLRRLPRETATPDQVRRFVESRVGACKWISQREDPEIVVRLRAEHVPDRPDIVPADLVTKSLTTIISV
jgi:hypothetical protein